MERRDGPRSGPLFLLGRVVATPDVLAAFDRNLTVGVADYLRRHLTGDWGELEAADRAENELPLREGFRGPRRSVVVACWPRMRS